MGGVRTAALHAWALVALIVAAWNGYAAATSFRDRVSIIPWWLSFAIAAVALAAAFNFWSVAARPRAPAPALGIAPEWLWLELNPCPSPDAIDARVASLEAAITRRRSTGQRVPPEWLVELGGRTRDRALRERWTRPDDPLDAPPSAPTLLACPPPRNGHDDEGAA